MSGPELWISVVASHTGGSSDNTETIVTCSAKENLMYHSWEDMSEPPPGIIEASQVMAKILVFGTGSLMRLDALLSFLG